MNGIESKANAKTGKKMAKFVDYDHRKQACR